MTMAFIIVRILDTVAPGVPTKMWNISRNPFPFYQTSSDVEAIVRTKFSVIEDYEFDDPCWWSKSIFENEHDEWSRDRERAREMHKNLFQQHSFLLKEDVKLNKNKDDLVNLSTNTLSW
jgi:hypothetical protein